MNIIFYTTGCPKCSVLKKKLDMAHIQYEVCRDTEVMQSKGMSSAPALEVEGKILNFKEAVEWLRGKVN